MATLVQDILDAAYARSLKNDPGAIASESTELVGVVNRTLQGLFAMGVRFNRQFYGTRETVAFATDGWPRPDNAESVVRIETSLGVKVRVVPFDDRAAEAALPAVYEYGQKFYSAGNANDPTSGNLVFFYSSRPRVLTALTGDPGGTIDPLWPEQFNEMLILSVAHYLATKDGETARPGEKAALEQEMVSWTAQYQQFLQHETAILTRRFGHSNRISTQGVQTQ